MSDDRLWDARELAHYLRVSTNTLNYWRFKGRGPRFVHVGRYVRYRGEDVDQWLEANVRGCTGGDGHA